MPMVDILGTLDEKIENNQRLAEKYESLIELYFDELLQQKNEHWEMSNLTSIAEYTNGLAMQKFRPKGTEYIPVIKIKELSQGHIDNNTEQADPTINSRFIINDGDVIFAWSGTLMVKLWCGGIGGLNQHLFKVTSNKYPKWFYYLWTKYHLQRFQSIAQGKAVTMGHIKREDLSKSIVDIPTKELFEMYDLLIEPFLEKIIALRIENRKINELKAVYLKKFFG